MTRSDRFVTVNDREIHYSAWGDPDAPPVVCVHGLSRVGRDFDAIAEVISNTYRVLCPDMPGRGVSEWSSDPEEEYTGSAMADLCVSFCDDLNIGELRWIGTSMGGTLGMTLAAGPFRERITHLVLNDVGPTPAEEGIDRIVGYLRNPPEYDRLSGLERFYRETYGSFSTLTDEEWRTFTVTSYRRTEDGKFTPAYDPRVVEPFITEELERDPWVMWEAIESPTFVLKGEHSDILSDVTFEEMTRRRPGIETLKVDCGHAPALNVPEQVDPVREFLAS